MLQLAARRAFFGLHQNFDKAAQNLLNRDQEHGLAHHPDAAEVFRSASSYSRRRMVVDIWKRSSS